MTTHGKKAREREARRRAAEARKRRRRNAILGVVGLIVVVFVVLALTRSEPEELAATETFPDLGGGHLAAGEAPPEYNSSPATSGRHVSSPAPCGVYTEEVPDSVQVHNLEHGTVVIQYQPDVSDQDREALEDFAREQGTHVLVAPRADLADPIVLTSWTRMLRMDGLDMAKVEIFYDRWARIGPELGVSCPFQVDQSS